MILVLNLGKLEQLLNGFGLDSWEIQTTSQRFWSRFLGNSNNCPTFLVLGSSNNCPTVLVLSHGKFKQQLKGFDFESSEIQTTAQGF